MYYTIYKISNKINGKIYIGSHKTKNLDDGYMGSGKYLNYAQEKHGEENFEKEILFIFDTPELMYAKEAELVNAEFIAEENTYNIKIGGFGGWHHINNDANFRIQKNKKAMASTRGKYKDKLSEWSIKGGEANILKNGIHTNFLEAGKTSFLGKTHSEETKKIIGNKNSINQKGTKNSQFGSMWIVNYELKKCMKILKSEPIPAGWVKGRKLLF